MQGTNNPGPLGFRRVTATLAAADPSRARPDQHLQATASRVSLAGAGAHSLSANSAAIAAAQQTALPGSRSVALSQTHAAPLQMGAPSSVPSAVFVPPTDYAPHSRRSAAPAPASAPATVVYATAYPLKYDPRYAAPRATPSVVYAQPPHPSQPPRPQQTVVVVSRGNGDGAANNGITCLALSILMLVASIFTIVIAAAVNAQALASVGLAVMVVSIISLAAS